ncbi:arsenite methyltransferase [Paenibacillus sepulcri]|uniref:Arsenite methyltransferase n=1 Tax=Paenibacillus sepulcri TaxID=359917 RepID=A0ABS7BY65_9BACL|nr:arsenite methyltransferase [Paenibacillus sepulcri]
MNQVQNDEIRQHVRSRYKQIALYNENESDAGCCAPAISCCDTPRDFNDISSKLGYSNDELTSVPEGANLGLGCGNPQAIASLQAGEVVVDLGSGGGFDSFLAAKQVGDSGKVIGVDMTPEMISRARGNALRGGYANTEFRLGEIEHLPISDDSVNVIISNCVINLSPDKQQVFNEAIRVLKPGGRLAISDIVTTAALPEEIKQDMDSLAGCISGASSIDEIQIILEDSGFVDIVIEPKDESKAFIRKWIPGAQVDQYIVSAVIKAAKAL